MQGDLALYGRWTDTVLYRREQRVRVPVRGFRRFGGDKKRGDYSGNGGGTSRDMRCFLVCDEEKPAYILNIENMGGEKAELVGRLGAKQMEG